MSLQYGISNEKEVFVQYKDLFTNLTEKLEYCFFMERRCYATQIKTDKKSF